jgi:Anti-anti-sigma regulatory factor (antagonist of anti-sigma factor)
MIAPSLKSEFIIFSNEGIPNMILDISDVKFVDSSGLSSILTANRLWKGSGGTFVLTGVKHPSVKKLIQISQLESVLTIIPTISESIDYIMMESLERELNADEE